MVSSVNRVTAEDVREALKRHRPGQVDAHAKIIGRYSDGKPTSAIVLPTRYGKSNLSRLGQIDLQLHGAPPGLIVSPSEWLSDQIVMPSKIREFTSLYGLPSGSLKARRMTAYEVRPFANGENLISVTTQLLHRRVEYFCELVQSLSRAHGGLRVPVWIDEATTISEGNEWGATALRLQEAGAYEILMTATPYRGDQAIIVGFDWEIVGQKNYQFTTSEVDHENQIRLIRKYDATANVVKLKSDHGTTFKQAWEENPSPLCKVSYEPFSVKVTLFAGTERERTVGIDELSRTEVLTHLKDIVRDPHVIEEGVRRLMQALRVRKTVDANAQGVVFVGNDSSHDGIANAHAEAVKREVNKQAPSLTVRIVTSSTADARETLLRFVDAHDGDVIILKQMGAIGLDAPKWKSLLDLSTIRKPGAKVQAWMRVATPDGTCRVCDVIAPADELATAIFNAFIKDEGGEARLVDADLVDEWAVPLDPDGQDDVTVVVESTDDSDFFDHRGATAQASEYQLVEDLWDRIPEIKDRLTAVELAERLRGIEWSPIAPATPTEAPLAVQIQSLRQRINDIARQINGHRVRHERRPYDAVSEETYRRIYRQSGVEKFTRLEQVTSIQDLLSILSAARRVAAEYGIDV